MALLETLHSLKSSRAIHRVAESALKSKGKLEESKEESGYLSADNFVRWTQEPSPEGKPFSSLLLQLFKLQKQVKGRMTGKGSTIEGGQQEQETETGRQAQEKQRKEGGEGGGGGARRRRVERAPPSGAERGQPHGGNNDATGSASGVSGVIFRPR